MKFLSLPKIGQYIAEKKEDTIEDPAFVNAQKVFMEIGEVFAFDLFRWMFCPHRYLSLSI